MINYLLWYIGGIVTVLGVFYLFEPDDRDRRI